MDKLKDIYYNPKTGYLSLNQLWKKLMGFFENGFLFLTKWFINQGKINQL